MIKGFNSLPYLGKPRVNETSMRPYFRGGRVRGGGRLTSRSPKNFWDSPNWVSKIAGFPASPKTQKHPKAINKAGLRIYLSYIHLTLLGFEESLIEHTSHLLANSAKKTHQLSVSKLHFFVSFSWRFTLLPFLENDTTQKKAAANKMSEWLSEVQKLAKISTTLMSWKLDSPVSIISRESCFFFNFQGRQKSASCTVFFGRPDLERYEAEGKQFKICFCYFCFKDFFLECFFFCSLLVEQEISLEKK